MQILIPVIIVAAIGLLAGVMLSLASKFMAVPTDEKTEKIRECLPGANCGACGYSGCDGYAAAIAAGEAEPNKCAPGGADAAKALAELLGVSVTAEKKIAFAACGRTKEGAAEHFAYDGMPTCAAAALTQGGPLECEYGCIGYGDCVKACRFGALELDENGRPHVSAALCTGCGMCAAACPKNIISVIPEKVKVKVRCSNCKKGAAVAKACKNSCIACGMCVKACESDAVHLENNLAVIDYDKCIGCGKCKAACKRGVIV